MSKLNKVPASAGAEWLLGGFALLRKAPLALGLLGMLWGMLSLLVVQVMALDPTVGLLLQLGLSVMGPLLFAGLLWAVHEVDHDRPAVPGHLLHALRSDKVSSLLATLLPQVIAALVLGALLLVLIGPDQLEQLAGVIEELQRSAQAGAPPDPELVRNLPVGRLFLWVLLMLGAAAASGLFVFVAVPQIMFGGRGGMAAMGDSFRACLRNLPAVLLFLALLAIALFGIGVLVQLLAVVVQLVAGATAAIWVSNLLLMAVLMPLMAGAVYHAWRQLLGTPEAAQPLGRFEA
ncbi:MAG TPA: BPSS1780 family membrane protein [Pseudoxanthomonas sp.]|nr:BPSS1780 family membrane protein [Pseudoxanthomonas sp.]